MNNQRTMANGSKARSKAQPIANGASYGTGDRYTAAPNE